MENKRPQPGAGADRQNKKSRSWFRTGCFLLVIITLLIAVIVAVMGYLLVKDSITAFRETSVTTRMLRQEFGKVDEYCPPAMGVITETRMEKFLQIRETLLPQIQQMKSSILDIISEFNQKGEELKFWTAIRLFRRGSKVIPQLAKYFTARNRLLIKAGMGLGEYYFVYVTCYYFYLGKSPEDGPDFGFIGRKSSLYYTIKEMLKKKQEPDKSKQNELWEYHDTGSRYRIRGFLLPMMICQLKQLKRAASDESGFRMVRRLEKEVNSMKARRGFWPWQNGLPDIAGSAIRPYTERLLNCYSDLLNPLEFGLSKNL